MTSIAATSSGTASSSVTPTTNGSFNEENLMRKLDQCTPTQESIQTLALWIIHHKNHHEVITKHWLKKMCETTITSKHRLTMFYLANDVIQNCKRKNAKIYQDSFKQVLSQAIVQCRSDSIKKNIERVLDVWLERQVYDKDFITKLISSVNQKASLMTRSPEIETTVSKELVKESNEDTEYGKDDIERIITEFQPKKLCESINTFEGFTKQMNKLKNEIESTRILDISLDHVKQYRDRTQCAKFKLEFENSCHNLQDYVEKLNELLEQRKKLVKLMQQSEFFYDAQYKDAKTVFNAYRSFGTKVHSMKKKLDELIETKFSNSNKNLENLDMEMSDDDLNTSHQTSLTNLPPQTKTQVRTNLDPRQNRHSHKRDDRSSKRDRSNTPVRDENPDNSSQSSNNSPLDFLTKFIKSSNQNEQPQTPTTPSSSNNLSFLVNSLQKFVNNGNPGGYNQQQNEYYNPSGINYSGSFMNQESTNRPGTPTKDEVYQPTMILPQPPGYNPMMVSPPPPPPYPMYQPQMNMIPPPPMVPGQLMIDPYQHMPYHPGYYPTPNKLLMSPVPPPAQQVSPLMSVQSQPPPVKSPKSNPPQNWNDRKNESPAKTDGNFQPKRTLLSNPILPTQANNINNNNKRKFNGFDDGHQARFRPYQNQANSSHNNRIPTINSQRDRGETGGANTNNNRSRFY